MVEIMIRREEKKKIRDIEISRGNMDNWYRINKLRGGLGKSCIFASPENHQGLWEKYIQKIVDNINKESRQT